MVKYQRLEGPWDFAYLGDVSFEAAALVKEEDWQRGQRWVPDAFNARPGKKGGGWLVLDSDRSWVAQIVICMIPIPCFCSEELG